MMSTKRLDTHIRTEAVNAAEDQKVKSEAEAQKAKSNHLWIIMAHLIPIFVYLLFHAVKFLFTYLYKNLFTKKPAYTPYQHFSPEEKAALLAPEPLPTLCDVLNERLTNRKPACPITNLVFQGGGVKGISHVGVILELIENGSFDNIQRVSGSSAGGLVAILVAVGYTGEEIEKAMRELDLSALVDHPNTSTAIQLWRYLRSQLDSGTKLENKVKDLIEAKLGKEYRDITFTGLQALKQSRPELKIKDLYLTGTNQTGHKATKGLTYFSHEAGHSPEMSIARAGRISAGHPAAFAPVIHNGDEYTDGAVGSNLPMAIFNKKEFVPTGYDLIANGDEFTNPATLGSLIESEKEIKKHWQIPYAAPQRGFLHAMGSFVRVQIYNRLFDHLTDEQHETVRKNHGTTIIQAYDLGVRTLNFTLTKEEQNQLIEAGRLECRRYFRNYRCAQSHASHTTPPEYKNFEEKYSHYNDIDELKNIIDTELTPALTKYDQTQEQLRKQIKALKIQQKTESNPEVLTQYQDTIDQKIKINANHDVYQEELDAANSRIASLDYRC